MRLSHARRAISARFDDPNLVSCAGLAAVLALAARCGLASLVADRVEIKATPERRWAHDVMSRERVISIFDVRASLALEILCDIQRPSGAGWCPGGI